MSSSSSSSSGFGLEEIGIPGREYLKEALTSCTDPLKAIEDFQVENGIFLPSLRPMLPLLDLHGLKRVDFHTSVLEDLRCKLIKHIETHLGPTSGSEAATGSDVVRLSEKERERKLKELLVKCFPVIRIPQLRPIVMAVLKQMSYIEDRYLRTLVRDKELYSQLDLVIKRHLWCDNQSLFGDEVSPFLSAYIKEKELSVYNNEDNFFAASPRARRQSRVVQQLAAMIGSNVKLYDMSLQFLRTLFLRTRNVHYCTLRAELLMALHDLEVQDIISVDPCHKFTWCLDACIREKNVDVKKSRELQGFLDALRRGQEQVLGDLSMTLCDPFAINFLATSALRIMNHQVERESMPRENPVLHLLLRMLALGLFSWEMIQKQEFSEPKLDSQIVTKFVPCLMALVVDDQVRATNAKLPPEERGSATIVIEHSGPPPEAFQTFIEQSQLATVLAMIYTLQTARAKDKTGVMRVLGILATSVRNHPFEDPFLHSLITHLIQMSDEFEAEDFCTVVFDEFFFTALTTENIVNHLLRLLTAVYKKLSASRLSTILKLTEQSVPSLVSEETGQVYAEMKTKIEEQLATLAAAEEEQQQNTNEPIL